MTLHPDELRAITASDAFLPELGRGTGWRPDPADSRDLRMKASAPGAVSAATLPAKASLRPHVPPVRDQGAQGACTGFGTAYGAGTLARRDSAFETVYSPQFVYNLARATIGELHLDEGAYIRDAVRAANKVGCARESDFPYYELQDIQHAPPTPQAMESARSWRLGEYRRCETLNDVRRALAAGQPVVFGFVCYQNLYAPGVANTGLIPEPGGAAIGGHAMMAAEYDDASRTVSGPNSWGRAWGGDGWFHLPYSYFESGKTNDMWAMTGEAAETSYPRRGAPA